MDSRVYKDPPFPALFPSLQLPDPFARVRIPPAPQIHRPNPLLRTQPAQSAVSESPENIRYKRMWSQNIVKSLYEATKQYCSANSKIIDILTIEDYAVLSGDFTPSALECMKKVREVLISGTTKSGAWCKAEDELLVRLIYEGLEWRNITTQLNSQIHAGLNIRNSKQCKERWNNHLNPAMSKQPWTSEEDLRLINLYIHHDNKWGCISKEMKNRSSTNVKNRVNSLINRERKYARGIDKATAVSRIVQKRNAEVYASTLNISE